MRTVGYLYGKKFGLKIAWVNQKEGDKGHIQLGKPAVQGKDPNGRPVVCEGEMGLCQNEEGAPWDGTDQTTVFQVAVSFL